ncbi:MAG: SIS domain-containing protein [Geminicoccaceae bacterium]
MQPDKDWLDRASAVVRSDAAAINAALSGIDGTFVEAARRLVECRGKILVTGSGTSGFVARRAAHLLSVGGAPAFYLAPADGLHGGLGVLAPEDWVLALSKGGGSSELNEFCARAKSLCGGLICITADERSPLAALSDFAIRLTLPEDGDLGGVVATGSSLAAAAVTDALVEICRVGRGYGWDKVLFTHPSGAVGRDAQASLQRLGQGER